MPWPCLAMQGGITFQPPIIGVSPATSPAPTPSGPWSNFTRDVRGSLGCGLLPSLACLHSLLNSARHICATSQPIPVLRSTRRMQPQALYIAIKTLNSTITGTVPTGIP